MEYIALVIGLIGLFMAWRVTRKNKELKERIAQANSRIYTVRREMQENKEHAERERMALKFEIMKLQGDLTITPDMKIGQILAVHPQAHQVLAGFHIGGCSSCMVDDKQSLGEAVAVNGRELEPVLVALNGLVVENGSGNGSVTPDQLKTPNIQLHI